MKKERDVFATAKYDVEHAIDLYADSFVVLHAEYLYEKEKLDQFKDIISKCHIYIVGFLPKIDFVGATQTGRSLSLKFMVANEDVEFSLPLPEGANLKVDDGYHYIEQSGDEGKRFWWDDLQFQTILCRYGKQIHFQVKYIGQAFGKDGERNALQRLQKHETLQKISIKGVPEGKKLSLLLLEVQPDNRVLTMFNPSAQENDSEGTRIRAGVDKLFNTSEAERTSLYEAALIRYFSPEFNKEFKHSFPSTNLKLLQDCYDKDFSAVFAQISIDELPFSLCSETVQADSSHVAMYALHTAEERDAFFCRAIKQNA